VGLIGFIKVGLDYANGQSNRGQIVEPTYDSTSRSSLEVMNAPKQENDWDYQPPAQ
jgi:hypothetical protein